MFGTKPTQKLPLLQRQNPQKSDNDLPRGECRFIQTTDSRERCNCVSFCLSSTIPGACGCGHQAWHHLREPTGKFVPLDDHLNLVDNFKKMEDAYRKLLVDVEKEKRDREKAVNDTVQTIVKHSGAMKYYTDEKREQLRLQTDDRLEQIEDKAAEAAADTQELRNKYTDLEDLVLRIIEDQDALRRPSRSLTPLLEAQASPSQPPMPERMAPELPYRIAAEHFPETWDIRIALILSRHTTFAYPLDSTAFRRSQTRGLFQDIHLKDKTSKSFTLAVESKFTSILRRRLWMPLSCVNSSELAVQQLDANYMKPSTWAYNFLEIHCIAHSKAYGGDVIFIALKDETLTWDDIKSLPRSFGSDERCWEYDEELDGPSKDAMAMDYTTETSRPTDSDSTYGDYNSPPPYVPNPETPRQLPVPVSPLHVLADASVHQRSYARSAHSAPSISDRSITSIDSVLSSEYPESEHRDKRTKRHVLPLPGIGALPSMSSSPPHSISGTQVIQSGRVKRKITEKSKYREPMDWRPSEIGSSFKSLLHKRPSTSSGSHPPPQPLQQQQQHSQPHLPTMPTSPTS